jgi:hypothetical protein
MIAYSGLGLPPGMMTDEYDEQDIESKVPATSSAPNNDNSTADTFNLDMSHLILSDEALKDKTKKWRQLTTKRYNEKRKFGYVET